MPPGIARRSGSRTPTANSQEARAMAVPKRSKEAFPRFRPASLLDCQSCFCRHHRPSRLLKGPKGLWVAEKVNPMRLLVAQALLPVQVLLHLIMNAQPKVALLLDFFRTLFTAT